MRTSLGLVRPGGFLSKLDIVNAYRMVPTAPKWWRLHAFTWRGVTYADLRLPFGSKGAVAAFARFSDGLRRFVSVRHPLSNYLDDFLAPALLRSTCERAFDYTASTLESLGWQIADEKSVRACQRLVFLGVGIATTSNGQPRMSVFLDKDRLRRIRLSVSKLVATEGHWAGTKALESLLGHLVFCAIVLGATRDGHRPLRNRQRQTADSQLLTAGDARGLLRASYSTLHRAQERGQTIVFLAPNVLAELKGWTRVYDADAYTRFVDRRLVETVFSAWDASSGVGLGVFFNGSGAYATWLEISQLPELPHSPKFTPDGKPLSPIAFLELYGEPPSALNRRAARWRARVRP